MNTIELLVKPWYEALEQGKLLGRKCKECGHIEFPPRYACNDCGCMETEWIEISGKAKATGLIPQSPMQNKKKSQRIMEILYGLQSKLMKVMH